MWHATGSLTCYAWTGQLEPGSEALSCTIRVLVCVRWSWTIHAGPCEFASLTDRETSGVSMRLSRLGTTFTGQIFLPTAVSRPQLPHDYSKLPRTARSACVCAR
eukprot:scaffold18185_cov49-Phaeocystis_antarctica.AAC.3